MNSPLHRFYWRIFSNWHLGFILSLLIILMSVFVLLLAFVVRSIQIGQFLHDSVTNDLTGLAAEMMEDSLDAVDTHVQELNAFSWQLSHESTVSGESTPSSKTAVQGSNSTYFQQRLLSFQDHMFRAYGYKVYEILFITDGNGVIKASTNNSLKGLYFTQEQLYKIRQSSPQFEDVEHLVGVHEPVLGINLKIESQGVFLGVLHGCIHLNDVEKKLDLANHMNVSYILNGQEYHNSREYGLMKLNGDTIYRFSQFDPDVHAAIDLPVSLPEHIRLQVSERKPSGLVKLPEVKHSTYMYVYATPSIERVAKSPDWAVVIKQANAPLSRQSRGVVLGSMLIASAGLFLFSFTILYIIYLIVIRPLRNVSEKMRSISDEKPDVYIPTGYFYEYNRMVESINGMTQKILTSQNRITALNENLQLVNATLRHDIVNQLTYIWGAINLYLEEHTPPKTLNTLLSDIVSALKKSISFVENMKTIEQSAFKQSDLRSIKLRDVISDVAKQYKNVRIHIAGDGRVYADEALSSILNNLIQNAIVHGKTDKIDITIKPRKEKTEVRVVDYGIGIPIDVQHKVFTRGFSYGSTGHTGIGLYVVKMTMQRYGGSVRLEDNHPHGCIFILEFNNKL